MLIHITPNCFNKTARPVFSERALSYGLGLSMVLTVRSELCLLSAIWYNPERADQN